MKALLKAFRRDERGVTAIEYAVLLAGVAGTLLVSLPAVGSSVDAKVAAVTLAMADPAPPAVSPAPKQCSKGGRRR